MSTRVIALLVAAMAAAAAAAAPAETTAASAGMGASELSAAHAAAGHAANTTTNTPNASELSAAHAAAGQMLHDAPPAMGHAANTTTNTPTAASNTAATPRVCRVDTDCGLDEACVCDQLATTTVPQQVPEAAATRVRPPPFTALLVAAVSAVFSCGPARAGYATACYCRPINTTNATKATTAVPTRGAGRGVATITTTTTDTATDAADWTRTASSQWDNDWAATQGVLDLAYTGWWPVSGATGLDTWFSLETKSRAFLSGVIVQPTIGYAAWVVKKLRIKVDNEDMQPQSGGNDFAAWPYATAPDQDHKVLLRFKTPVYCTQGVKLWNFQGFQRWDGYFGLRVGLLIATPTTSTTKTATTTITTTTAARWFLATAGDNGCPSGSSAVPRSSCFSAARAAGAAEGRKGYPEAATPLYEGAWGHTPPGCFVHAKSNVALIMPHFSTGAGQNNGNYQSVCEKHSHTGYPAATTTAAAAGYISLANGPGCTAGQDISSAEECGNAAAALGFADTTAGTLSLGNIPLGCVVGSQQDGWQNTYFNTMTAGQTGVSQYRSICKQSTTKPYQIAAGTDGWCFVPGAVHQDVPGCGRVCEWKGERGVKKNGDYPNAPCDACPGAEWASCAAATTTAAAAACPVPVEDFGTATGWQSMSGGRGCPASGCTNALNANVGFASFADAWAACGAVANAGCAHILKFHTGYYYLRRESDPVMSTHHQGMPYSCTGSP